MSKNIKSKKTNFDEFYKPLNEYINEIEEDFEKNIIENFFDSIKKSLRRHPCPHEIESV